MTPPQASEAAVGGREADVLDGFGVASVIETPECFTAGQRAAARACVRDLVTATKELQEKHARFFASAAWSDDDDDAQATVDRAIANIEGQP